MRSFILQNKTVHYWRVIQMLLVVSIMSLEAAQIKRFRPWYYEEPSHGGAPYYWLVLFITFIVLLYFLSNFSYIWKNGPYKYEIYLDIFLTHLWIVVSLLNILSGLTGGSLTCNYPKDENQYDRTTRCRLFLSSVSLGWIIVPTYIVSSYISIMRWRKRPIEAMPPKFVDPPIVVHKPETYLVQKGVLADGQPVLLFHMTQKNASNSNLSTRGGTSGNVTPTSSDFTSQANSSRVSVYLHDKDVKP